MSRIVRQIITLSLIEWKYLLLSLVYLPRVDSRVKKHGLKKTKAWIEVKYSQSGRKPLSGETSTRETARIIGRMVVLAAKWGPLKAKCLTRALVIFLFLHEAGLSPSLIIGTSSTSQTNFEAHAWVEYMGVPVGQSDDVRLQFRVFE